MSASIIRMGVTLPGEVRALLEQMRPAVVPSLP
jgi:hypothetical protein